MERHIGERKVRAAETDSMSVADSITSMGDLDDVELDISDATDDGNDDDNSKTDEISEQGTVDEVEGEENFDEGTAIKGEKEEETENKSKRAVSKEPQEEKGAQFLKQEEEELSMFPDTNINLMHVKGDK